MAHDQTISSCSGWLTRSTTSYTLVQKENGWVTRGAKYTLGTVVHGLETLTALVDLVVANFLLLLAAAPHFLLPEASAQRFDEKVFTPLREYAVDAAVAMCTAGSRVVTNFTGNHQEVETSLRSSLTTLPKTPPNLEKPDPSTESPPIAKLIPQGKKETPAMVPSPVCASPYEKPSATVGSCAAADKPKGSSWLPSSPTYSSPYRIRRDDTVAVRSSYHRPDGVFLSTRRHENLNDLGDCVGPCFSALAECQDEIVDDCASGNRAEACLKQVTCLAIAVPLIAVTVLIALAILDAPNCLVVCAVENGIKVCSRC